MTTYYSRTWKKRSAVPRKRGESRVVTSAVSPYGPDSGDLLCIVTGRTLARSQYFVLPVHPTGMMSPPAWGLQMQEVKFVFFVTSKEVRLL